MEGAHDVFLSPETLTELIALEIEPAKLARILHMIERDAESVQSPRRSSDSKAAERMRRYRSRREENGLDPNFKGYLYVEQLRERDGDRCVYCQEADGDTVDHITPVSRGGTDDIDNLALACNACNGGKAGREPVGRYEPKVASAKAAHSRYVRSRSPEQGEQAEQGEQPLSPSPSPQTPQPRPHTRGDIYTPAREVGPSKAEIAKGFVAFWAAYPRRKSKDAAAKAFEKAMRRIEDPDPLAVILAGIERALPGWDDPNFIPYPASWLNAGGWEDEPPTPKTTTPTSPRNDRPDRFAAKQANYQSALAGADWADQVLVARRGF